MKNPIGVFSLLLAMAGGAWASSYGPDGRVVEYQQPRGKKLSLRVLGDEFYARTETSDGYTVVFNQADQSYYYARTSANGDSFESTGIKVGAKLPAGLIKHQTVSAAAVGRIAEARRNKFDAERALRWEKRVNGMRLKRQREAGLGPAAGDAAAQQQAAAAEMQAAPVNGGKVGLTILVQFPDDAQTAAADPTNFPTNRAKIERFCNGVGYTEDGNSGSVRDYFDDQSNGLLNYTQAVTEVVTLPNPRSYYNYSNYPSNTTLREAGAAGRLIIQEAVAILKNSGFNFNDLTVDGGNRIMATNVLFAGRDSGVWAQGLWPHQWVMSGSGVNVGTASAPRYVSSYQITNIANATPVIGTFCHENGHLILGFPDIYDSISSNGSSSGVGSHCLMGSANYNNGGRTPGPINIAFKDMVGWADIADLTTADGLSVSLPSSGNIGRRFRKPGSNTEYFIVENRGIGDLWAAGAPDRGICIWHIDEVKNGNGEQQMTAAQHYEVSLEQADGEFDLEGNRGVDASDLFDSADPDFSDATTPDAKWWDGTDSGIKIHVASAAGANMNVEFGQLLPANTVAVQAPNGGKSYDTGSVVNIAWGANIAGNVKIELLKNNVLQSVIAANEVNDGAYAWTIPIATTVGGDYKVRISSVDNPAYSDVSDAVFAIQVQPTLEDVLDSPNLVWASSGNANWYSQSTVTHDGVDAAQCGDITHSQNSSLQTTITGPCTLSFWWKVSSEASYDFLRFYLDGTEQGGSLARISGLVDWTQKTVVIPAGTHTVKWSYTKDSIDDANLDSGWIDQVSIRYPEIAVEQPVNNSLIDGSAAIHCGTAEVGTSTATRSFTIRNADGSDLTGLAISKNGSHAADFAVSGLGVTTLAPGASTTFTVTFTAGAAGQRSAAIHIASNDLDENPFDISLSGEGSVTAGSIPVAGNDSAVTAEDMTAVISVLTNDSDSDGDTLSIQSVTQGAHGTVAISGTQVTYTPAANWYGTDGFNYTITDGQDGTATATVSVTVNAANDAPFFTVDPINLGATEDTALAGQLAAADIDPDSTLTFSKLSGPSWLTVAPSGALSGTPLNANVGANAFVVRVTDAGGAFDEAVLSISVTNVNDAPVFTVNPILAANATLGAAYTGQTLAGSATDADSGDVPTYTKVSGPSWLSVASNGTLSGTPPVGSGGLNTFVVRATDNNSATADAELRINVSGLPLPWTSGDIGTGMLAGSASHNSGTFTLAGSGALGGTSDKLQFMWQALSGNGEITARVSALQNTGSSSRVGVMIRETLATNSRQVFFGLSGAGDYRWERRFATGGNNVAISSGAGAVPNTWVRLVRSGSMITASKSSDGISWTTVASGTVSMAANCYIGLAVSSGSNTTLNTSQLSNVSVTP